MENGGGEREEGEEESPVANPRAKGEGGLSCPEVAAAPDRHMMRWESFLPRRALRVLLVEGDDSTRHIVTALLRKCSYRVAGVADGMKAWDVMKEKRYCFDLVLTEVAMPTLSGIGLLTKIMSVDECKNIPVIMMSTHDSVNVVLKCMLKGAVDFLVKPVRKNELRNLWQHVWRRHCSNGYINATDNNTASNQISTNVGGRYKTEETSDERSDAQSSGSKRDTEIESIQKHEEPPQVEDMCTGEGEANLDSSDKDIAIRTSVSKMDSCGNTKNYEPMVISVGVTLPIQETSVPNVSQEWNRPYNIFSYREENLDLVRSTKGNNDDPKSYCQNNPAIESVQNMTVFVEPISNGQCTYAVSKEDALVKDGLCEAERFSNANEASNAGISPLWELSLRRPQLNGCVQSDLKVKNVLKHSVTSAFSRYGEKTIHSSFRTASSDLCIRSRECVEKCHSLVSNHDTDNEKNTPFSHTEKRLVSFQGNGGEFQVISTNKENPIVPLPPTENDCTGHSSTVDDTVLPCPQFGFMPLPIPVGAMPYQSLGGGYGGILQPVFYPETSFAPHKKPATQFPSSDHSVHQSNHCIYNSFSLEFQHCEVSNHPCHWRQAIDISEPGGLRELCNHMEHAYQSGSCSHDVLKGSGNNGSGEAADGAQNRTSLESGNESGVQNCNRKALDCDRSLREAALIKFHMKRKERCFEKKVRYYSRKKLAEERPRIKGQFVRHKVSESKPTAGDNCL